jgi:hypothetical protein
LEKEEEAKITSLGSQRRINHVLNLMGVEYEDRPMLAILKDDAIEKVKGEKPNLVKEKGPDKEKGKGALSGSARPRSLMTCV